MHVYVLSDLEILLILKLAVWSWNFSSDLFGLFSFARFIEKLKILSLRVTIGLHNDMS